MKRTDATSDPLPILLVVTASAYELQCNWQQKIAPLGATFRMTGFASHLAPRTRYSLQDLLLATALVAAYLGALSALRRGLTGYELNAYWVGIVWGAICTLGFLNGRRTRTKQLGRLRIHLAAQIDWRGFVLSQLILLLAYIAILTAMLWSWERETSSVVLGLAFVTASSAVCALLTFIRPRMELREQGIAVGIWTAFPWRKVRLRRWEQQTTGRLALESGFVRAVAIVPEELRDEVDALLREKFKLAGAVS